MLGQLQAAVSTAVELHCLDRSSRFDVRAIFRLAQLYRETDADFVHAHSSSVYIAVAAALLRPSTVVYHEHFGWSERIDDVTPWLIRPITGLIGGVLVVNDLLSAWMKRSVFGSEGLVLYLRNFAVSIAAGPEKVIRRERLRIVCMANFRPQKDHLTLIRAVHQLRTVGVDCFEVALLGKYDYNDIYYQTVLAEIDASNMSDCIHIEQSIVDVDSFLSECSIGVLSSRSEGLPLTLLEYARNNLAVIASNVGQCAEVLNYGRDGLLVPPGDENALAAALKLLIDMPEMRETLAHGLHEHVRLNYTPDAVMPVLHKFYGSIRYESMLA